MESVKELREYASHCAGGMGGDALRHMADAIEAEHKTKLHERYRRGYSVGYDAGYDVGFASADDWLADNGAALAEHGWVELPVGADGVPIRVGDVMKGEKVGGGFGEPFEVVGYIMSNGELEPMDEHKNPRKHRYSHHHHEPTVEDMLREFYVLAVRGKEAHAEDVDADVLAEYAAKLRLAGEGE